jgi:hypothetical protein
MRTSFAWKPDTYNALRSNLPDSLRNFSSYSALNKNPLCVRRPPPRYKTSSAVLFVNDVHVLALGLLKFHLRFESRFDRNGDIREIDEHEAPAWPCSGIKLAKDGKNR